MSVEPLTKIERVRKALALHDAGYAWVAPDRFAIEYLLLAYDDISRRHKILLDSCQSAVSSG